VGPPEGTRSCPFGSGLDCLPLRASGVNLLGGRCGRRRRCRSDARLLSRGDSWQHAYRGLGRRQVGEECEDHHHEECEPLDIRDDDEGHDQLAHADSLLRHFLIPVPVTGLVNDFYPVAKVVLAKRLDRRECVFAGGSCYGAKVPDRTDLEEEVRAPEVEPRKRDLEDDQLALVLRRRGDGGRCDEHGEESKDPSLGQGEEEGHDDDDEGEHHVAAPDLPLAAGKNGGCDNDDHREERRDDLLGPVGGVKFLVDAHHGLVLDYLALGGLPAVASNLVQTPRFHHNL